MQPRQRLGPYIIHDEIARGGQGAVYLAVHSQLGTRVAVKVLLDAGAGGSELKRFRQEAKVLARLNHPNILKVVDMGVAAGPGGEFPYIAMEYIDGQDLKGLLREGYPARKAAENLVTVAEALDYCHEMGITHRDLKPANIVIEEATGRPVIIDFGLVKRDAGKMGLASLDQSRLSLTGEVKGTPQYMAPEQLDSGGFGIEGPMVDVYALGGILYYTLVGRTPFQGASAYNIMVKIMRDEAVDPREIDPALSKDPGDRPGSAGVFAEMLREALSEGKKKRGIRRASERNRRSQSRLIPGLVAGGMLVAGLGGYGYYHNRKAGLERQRLSRIAEKKRLSVIKKQRIAAENKRQRLAKERELGARAEAVAAARREIEQDRAEAEDVAQREIEQDPMREAKRSIQIYENSIRAWKLGDRDKAMRMIDSALELWPDNAMALVQRSTFNALLGNKQAALRDVKKGIYIYEIAVKTQNMDINDPKLVRARELYSQILSRRHYRRYR
jgi:serine/threonine-protein kinase